MRPANQLVCFRSEPKVGFRPAADVVIITAMLIRDEVRVTAQPLITALRAAAARW